MAMNTNPNLAIKTLGERDVDSPIANVVPGRARTPDFVEDDEHILLDDRISVLRGASLEGLSMLELAGPRQRIFFDPEHTHIGIVTCGGLCPGLNDVIRGIVMEAFYGYGIRHVTGFRYGYEGLVARYGHPTVELTPQVVSDIHEKGGSFLASSRGPQEPSDIVDTLEHTRIGILFVIGGDGTMRGALAISAEAERRGLPLAVVGVPKTVDNDLCFIDRSFGFESAYSEAVRAIGCAHNEALGTYNGIGLVKVMGRHSGFLACHATLATNLVNFCLIPEMRLGRDNGRAFNAFLSELERRLETSHHALVVVAEGTGQDFVETGGEADASGNAKLADVGVFLSERITAHLDAAGVEHGLKYIDPSYIVRSVPAGPADSIYCWQLARNAVHAAMSGKTDLVVGHWHGRMVHVPIEAAISERNLVDTESDLWLSVLETTGQPPVFE